MRDSGINLIGYLRGRNGLGEGARRLGRTVIASGTKLSVYSAEIPGAMVYGDNPFEKYVTAGLPHDVSILHMNPPETEWLYETQKIFRDYGGYVIGYWLWELERIPEAWVKTLRLVDEVWSPSEFVCETFRKCTDKPVRKIPYPISAQFDDSCGRDHFGIKAGIIQFLCMFDTLSSIDRKNPVGAIRAFKQAFYGRYGNVGLIIKISNPNSETISLISKETEGIENLRIISESLPRTEVNALINCCDVFVSLHRAEGFGLAIAEAMYLGKAVVSTNYSSSTEFTSEDTCCLIDYTLIDIPVETMHYGGMGQWAEPNIDIAAKCMARLASDKGYRERMGKAAKKYIRRNYSEHAAAKKFRLRMREIYKLVDRRKL